ncbi:hypothetical protein BGZ68_005337 [Mortierella alpina]|nr:hypothetical protein BGZ68_005337 [Mortierella alpina]
MIRIAGTPHHLALAVKSLAAARPFYEMVLSPLGYKYNSPWDPLQYIGFRHEKTGFEIGFSPSLKDSPPHVKGHIGYHHFALTAESKEQVDTIYKSLVHYYKEHGGESGETAGKILDAPRLYPEYGHSYYALFFTDADGHKLEIAV